MTVIAVHQPMFLPYEGFWSKALQADRLVLMTNTPSSKGDGVNRVRLHPDGHWLTVPVTGVGGRLTDLRYQARDLVRIERTLSQTFTRAKTKNYGLIRGLIDCLNEYAQAAGGSMVELNIRMIREIMHVLSEFGPVPEVMVDSGPETGQSTTSRLMHLIRRNTDGPAVYLSGSGGRAYLNPQEIPASVVVKIAQHSVAKDQTVLQSIAQQEDPLDYLLNCVEFTRL